ncbi:MAG: BCCT family transporter, partial [Anaerolineae bacterium]|nr:BCCT family transporter [Anaerolineae bacterium]
MKGLQVQPTASIRNEVPDRQPGDTNIVRWGFDLHPQVSFIAGGLLILFIAGTLLFQEQANLIFSNTLNFISSTFGWFYILAANVYLIVMVIFAFSKFGKIRLGGPNAQPEFTTFAWYAMLISAGMGIGLMFWSVGEPIFHMEAPPPLFPDVEPGSAAAAQVAMGITYYHWGLHPWGLYALVGLSLGFFAFNRG